VFGQFRRSVFVDISVPDGDVAEHYTAEAVWQRDVLKDRPPKPGGKKLILKRLDT
jgi:hypothetical protein